MTGQSNVSYFTVKWLNYTEEESNLFARLAFPIAYIHAKFYLQTNDKKLENDNSEDDVVIIEGPLPQTSTARVWNSFNSKSESQEDGATHWPIYDLEMKCLARLKVGMNEIKVSAFSQDFTMNFLYEPWESSSKRYVKLIYIVCDESDGSFLSPNEDNNNIAAAKKKISLNATMLQTFVAENLNAHGLGRVTFELEEPCYEPPVNVFQSKLKLDEARAMSGDELYKYFHKEINTSDMFDSHCKFLTFMSCTGYSPPTAPEEFNPKKSSSYVQAHTALGGGNLALFGTGGLHTWAGSIDEVPKKFSDERVIDKRKLFDDSCGRGTYWANYATTLGATIHELGHAFDLAHTNNGIMGRGFDDMDQFFVATERGSKNRSNELAYYNGGSHWFRSSAVILKSHKWLSQIRKSSTSKEEEFSPIIYTDPIIRGPFGIVSSDLNEDGKFDSREWCKTSNTELIGIVIYYDTYLNALQFVGRRKHNSETHVSEDEDDESWEEIDPNEVDDEYDDEDEQSLHEQMDKGADDFIDNTEENVDYDEEATDRREDTLEEDENQEGDYDNLDHMDEEKTVEEEKEEQCNAGNKKNRGEGKTGNGKVVLKENLKNPSRKLSDIQEHKDTAIVDKIKAIPGKDIITNLKIVEDEAKIHHVHGNDDLDDVCIVDEVEDDDAVCQDSGLVYSPIYGKASSDSKSKYTFWLTSSAEEKITAIDIRAGAWVDAIRFHSDMKSSVWFGGQGGNCYRVPINHDLIFHGLYGSFEHLIESLGVSMAEKSHNVKSCRGTKALQATIYDEIHLEASGNIQVVEVQNKEGTVVKYFDFSDKPSQCAVIPKATIAEYLPCRLYLIDDKGLLAGLDVE